jgi:hypothetical protein
LSTSVLSAGSSVRCGFAGCAALALPSLWSGLADGAFAAAFGHGLPAIFAGNGSWIDVADRDEAAAVVFDDVKLCVFFIHIERTTEARRAAVAAIAAGACEQDPILVTGLFARILTCLINAAIVDDNVACVVHRVRLPGID